MLMRPGKQDQALIESWRENAGAWTDAVRGAKIESRRLVTDAAIVNAIRSLGPRRVLDLGCGEGWLCRHLRTLGMRATGIDGSQPLIEHARGADPGGDYVECSYADFCARPGAFGHFDVIVANFSILGDDLSPILQAAHTALDAQGHLIVQTVHPACATGDEGQTEGWRIETFAAFEGDFPSAMPWYLRTLASWRRGFADAGLFITDTREPLHPKTGLPASLLFVARRQ